MLFNQRVAALVPMKDHSERVKGKNMRDFCGKPLYEHILQTLDRTYAVDEILINTDSPRITLEAPKVSSKVKILERPEALRGDLVSMNKIIAHDLEHTDAQIILQTHSTSPLLKAETIAQALKAFAEDDACDSLFGVNAYHSRFYFQDGRPVNHDPEDLIRTQDLPPLYEENSSLYVFTHESFARRQRRIGEKPRFFPIPKVEATDIDDEFTFRLAELLSLYAASSNA